MATIEDPDNPNHPQPGLSTNGILSTSLPAGSAKLVQFNAHSLPSSDIDMSNLSPLTQLRVLSDKAFAEAAAVINEASEDEDRTESMVENRAESFEKLNNNARAVDSPSPRQAKGQVQTINSLSRSSSERSSERVLDLMSTHPSNTKKSVVGVVKAKKNGKKSPNSSTPKKSPKTHSPVILKIAHSNGPGGGSAKLSGNENNSSSFLTSVEEMVDTAVIRPKTPLVQTLPIANSRSEA